MRKKRKQKARSVSDKEPEARSEPAPAVTTTIGPLLTRAGLNKLALEPSPVTLRPRGPKPASLVPEPVRPVLRSSVSAGELSALNAAYRGVQPIRRSKHGRTAPNASAVRKAPAPPDPAEEAARERLSALVADGVRFEVRWDEGWVQGLARGVTESLIRRLSGASFEPEARLDLHGHVRAQAARAVHEFVRVQHRRGARHLLVIVGKGLHSEGGVGVLAETVVEALTRSVAAPLVAAFASADARHGGRGAVAVMLR